MSAANRRASQKMWRKTPKGRAHRARIETGQSRRARIGLKRSYIVDILAKRSSWRRCDIPASLIRAKRVHIQLFRKLKKVRPASTGFEIEAATAEGIWLGEVKLVEQLRNRSIDFAAAKEITNSCGRAIRALCGKRRP